MKNRHFVIVLCSIVSLCGLLTSVAQTVPTPPKPVTLSGTATITYTPPTTVVGPPGAKGDKGEKGDSGLPGKDGRDGKDAPGNGPSPRWPGAILYAADNPGDARAAIQAALDGAGKSGLTLVGQFAVGDGPVYQDTNGSDLGGFSKSGGISGADSYGGPVLAVGVRRLEKAGLDPKDFRRVTGSIDATGNANQVSPRSSLATRGKVALMVPSHPASLGASFSTVSKPDYWQADAYAWDLFIEHGDGPMQGMLVSAWGSDEPAPFGFVGDETSKVFRFYWKTSDQAFRQQHVLELPMVGPGPWRIAAQWDGKAGRTDFWVNDAWISDQSAPGKLAKPKGVDPFAIGAAHGYLDGTITDMVCSGFRATRGRVYAPQPKLTRLDGTPTDDRSRFFSVLKSPVDPALGYSPLETFAILPLTDAPATHVRIDGAGYTGVGFWIPPKLVWCEDLSVSRLDLKTSLQPSLVIGPTYGVTVDDADLDGGTQGLATLPLAAIWPLRLNRVKASGDDCAMLIGPAICYADHVTFQRSGRECLRFNGGSFIGNHLFVAFISDATEYFMRFYAQGYGNAHQINDLLVDNEEATPNLKGAVWMESSLYSVNRLSLNHIGLGRLPADAPFLTLVGHGLGPASGGYGRAIVDAKNLSSFSPVGVGLKVDGVGWCGNFDGSGLTPFKVVGDAGFITVTQPIPPMPGEPVP